MNRVASTLLIALMVLLPAAPAFADDRINGGGGDGTVGVVVDRKIPAPQVAPPTQQVESFVVECDSPERSRLAGSHLGTYLYLAACTYNAITCTPALTPAGLPLRPVVVATRVPPQPWSFHAECRAGRPAVTPALVRAEVVKLLPEAPIRTGPPGGRALVNLQVLFWADTPVDRDLGPVTLLGHRVDIRIYAAETRWDFGDGSSDVSDGPGVRYDAADHCTTRICPGYFGHIYDRTGPMTVSATVRWAAEFRVDGGQWQAINDADATPQVIDGPTSTTNLTIVEARGVLVEASPR